jgi:hypothetical protein
MIPEAIYEGDITRGQSNLTRMAEQYLGIYREVMSAAGNTALK